MKCNVSIIGQGSGKVYNPTNPHPTLSKDVQNSFSGRIFKEVKLSLDTTFYRVYGGKSGQVGSYMTRAPQNGGMQSQMDLALDPKWGNTAQNVTTVIYEGTAAPQVINGGAGTLAGGGNQIYIPEVNPAWFK